MAYSKNPRVLTPKPEPPQWPDLRYDPVTGNGKLFFSPESVPLGWLAKRPAMVTPREGVILDRDELVGKLTQMGVEIDPTWGNAHMKRIIDGDVSPTG